MQEVWNQTQYKLWYIFVKFVHGLYFVLFYVLFVRKSNFHFSLWVHLFPHHMWNVNKFSQYKSVHRMFDNHWNEKSNRKHFIQKDPISMCISFFVCKSCDIIKKKNLFKMLTSFEITCRSINTSLFVIHAQWKYLHKCLEGQNSKPTSYTEYLRAMRDYKRRRQSYRAKNVHITRKSYTEVTRLISRFVWFVECSLQET